MSNGFEMIIEVCLPLLLYFGLPFIIWFFATCKKVPPNTTIIIDRDSHFYKKKSRGYYRLKSNDKVTTIVSKNPVTETYSNTFKTHDDKYFTLSFSFKYASENPDQTLDSLSDSRRSIYDVANCAVETVIGSLMSLDVMHWNFSRYGRYGANASKNETGADIDQQVFKQLESSLEYFYIDVTESKVISCEEVKIYDPNLLFHRHESSGGNPIQ